MHLLHSHPSLRQKILLGAAVFFSGPLFGQSNDIWLGGAGNWSNPSKWSAGVPTASSNVFIDNGNGTASAITVDGGAVCNNLTVDSDDILTISPGGALTVNGTTITNSGQINITDSLDNLSTAVLSIAPGHSVMLGGSGIVTLKNGETEGGAILSGGSGSTLINSSTIQGGGEIGGGGLALINQNGGVINANQPRPGELFIDPPSGTTNQGLMEATDTSLMGLVTTVNNSGGTITASGDFSGVLNFGVIEGGTLTTLNNGAIQNSGILKSSNGSTLTLSGKVANFKTIQTQGNGSKVLVPGRISNAGSFKVGCGTLFQITGTFTNFANETLTGSYSVCGKLQFNDANVVNNQANITLIGSSSAIVDQANNDGLRNLASTGRRSSLTLSSGRNMATPGGYSNTGKLAVNGKTKFTINGAYTQTPPGMANERGFPTTKVDGTLSASSGSTVQGGNISGTGAIVSTVVSSGSVTAGDSATKPGALLLTTYTQNASGTLNIAIGGLTAGTQYGQLAVANGVGLAGTLNLTLIKGFVPAIGDRFTILTASAVSGTFSTVNGLSINSGEHFTITYNPTSVILAVVSGP